MASTSKCSEPILTTAVYTKTQLKERASIGESAYQQARKAGLVVRHVHGRSFVTGQAWWEYLESQASHDSS
jgi:hypothetical protein